VYFTTSQIPELAGLSSKQRQIVKRDCLYPLSQRPSFFASSHITMLASIVLGVYLAHSMKAGFWTTTAMLGLCIFGLGYVHDMVWVMFWRPWIRRYVQDQKELAKLQAGG